MTHDDVRAALVSDEPVPTEARAHLAACDACLAFARGLERVRRAAPLLVPAGPPAGLADRVVAEVEALPRAAAAAVPVRRSFGRRALVRVAVGAAATLVVAAAAVALRPDPSPRVELAAAARRTADARTAKVRLDGTTTFVLPVGDARTAPEFASVPDALRAEVERQWQSLMDVFRRAMEAYEKQLDEALGRIDDALDGVLPTSLPRPPPVPRLPRMPTPSPPALPPSITTTVSLRASGDVSFTDRLRLSGAVGVDGEAAFDLVAGRDGVAVRAEGTPWAAAEARVGPWGVVVGGPDELLRAVGAATDVTRDDAQRYRFRIRSLDGTVLAGEADVDPDGRLSAVRLTASGRTGGLAGATWTTDLRVAFSEPGAPVAPVDVGDVRDRVGRPDDASRVIYPLGPGVRAAAEATR